MPQLPCSGKSKTAPPFSWSRLKPTLNPGSFVLHTSPLMSLVPIYAVIDPCRATRKAPTSVSRSATTPPAPRWMTLVILPLALKRSTRLLAESSAWARPLSAEAVAEPPIPAPVIRSALPLISASTWATSPREDFAELSKLAPSLSASIFVLASN